MRKEESRGTSPALTPRRRRGEICIDAAVRMIVASILLVLALSALGVAMTSVRLHTMSAELTRYVELHGQVDGDVDTKLADLSADTGISAIMAVDAAYIHGTQRVQFGDEIRIALSTQTELGIGGILSVPITLTAHTTGRSEVYWK